MTGKVHVTEGTVIDWSPMLAARMVVFGVQHGDRDVPRMAVLRKVVSAFRAWFEWTTALPGDRFHDFPRDLLIEVRGGLPGRRTAGYVTGQARCYPIVQRMGVERMGVDAVFALTPSEPCGEEWWQVERVGDTP